MAAIGTASLIVTANAASMETNLKKAGDGVSKFVAKSKSELFKLTSVAEVGEKLGASLGRITSAAGDFDTLTSSADGFAKAIAASEIGVSSLTVGIQLASKVASGLKAALLGSGIGLAVAGIGALVSALKGAKTEAQSLMEGMDESARTWLTAAAGTSAISTPGDRSAWEGVLAAGLGREGAATAVSAWAASGGGATLSAEEIGLAPRGVRARSLATSGEATAAGVSADEAFLREAEADVRRLGTATPVLRAFAEDVSRARAAMSRAEGTRFVDSIADATAAARASAATTGMSADAAAEYGLMMRETTRRIGDFTVTTRESLTPLEAHRRRLESIAATDLAAIGASEARMRDEIRALGELREARLAAAGAAETERLVSAEERHARELERIVDLYARGATSAETLGRGLQEMWQGVIGDVSTPLDRMRNRIDEIQRARAEIEGTAAFLGVSVEDLGVDLSGMDAAMVAALGTDTALPRMATAGPQALQQGTSEAIAEANRIIREQEASAPQDPVERTNRILEMMARNDERARDATERIARALESGEIVIPAGL